MRSRVLTFFGAILGVLLFMQCSDNRIGDNWTIINPDGWPKDSVQTLEFNIQDTVNYHTLNIGIRNTDMYRYRNLWLFISTETPGGKQHTDTFEIMLASEEGNWHGSGWGNLFSVVAPYREVRFLETGTFKFTIKQGMRHDVLEGIESVGIRINKSDQ